ncbi:MAG: aromatic amino acid lyase, partial [Candidatus Njordarchaeota archaeon]
IPAVPKYGSVGASGDPAPLAHIAMVLVGAPHSKAFVNGTIISGSDLKKILFEIYSGELDDFYRKNNIDVDYVLLNENAIDSNEFLLNLSYKESLSLINGTDFESAIMAIAIHRIKNLFNASLLSLALTIEALRGIIDAFDALPIDLLNHNGARFVSNVLRSLLQGSKLIIRRNQKIKLRDLVSNIDTKNRSELVIYVSKSKLMFYGVSLQRLVTLLRKKLGVQSISLSLSTNSYAIHIEKIKDTDYIENIEFTFGELGYVQDAYSVRCSPKVYGIVYDFINFAESVIINEINAVTDNPIIINDNGFKIFSAGNFHGQPIGFVADSLKVCLGYIGGISERRIFRLLDPNLNRELPAFLSPESGLNTGLMISQYTAAALTSLNKICSHVSSIDSLPTSANQEDWNSMALNSAWMLMESIKNTTWIIATEILCAAQAVMLRTNSNIELLGRGTKKFMRTLMRSIGLPIKSDRYFKLDIEKIIKVLDNLNFEDLL